MNLNIIDMIRFRLLDKTYSMSQAKFNCALGVVVDRDTFYGYSAKFNPLVAFHELTRDDKLHLRHEYQRKYVLNLHT